MILYGSSTLSVTNLLLVVITANATPLDGKLLPLKTSLEGVLDNDDMSNVQHVLVFKRTNDKVPMKAGRDEWLEEVYSYYNIAKYSVYALQSYVHFLGLQSCIKEHVY